MMAPKDVHMVSPGAYEYVTLSNKRDLSDVIKDLEVGGYPGLSRWTQCNHKWFYKREEEGE